MQTHLTPRSLKPGVPGAENVQVLFSANPSRKGILFIHGFGGNGLETWSNFSTLLPEYPKFKGTDLYFYSYDGLRDDMYASAAIFRVLLENLFTQTAGILVPNLPLSAQRSPDFAYDELAIVAHSLGAVIARRALLDATTQHASWAPKTKLVLYAPAHMGANVVGLALEATSLFRFLKLFGSFVRFTSPLIDQLRSDSPHLKQLLDDTIAAIANGNNTHLIAKQVVIASRERIVSNSRFGNDPPAYAIPDTSHITVCKPRKDFLTPLEYLEQCL
jgi:pimeloyl-ACP methyl ester carboxylesterase